MSKIDVHHHVYPPVFSQAIKDAGGDPSGWYVPPWTIEADKDISKAVGNKTAILSVTAPGVSVVGDLIKAAHLARQVNDYVWKLRNDDPEGYGFFGSLPSLLDTEACLREIDYIFDELHADGVTLFTRYGTDNHYLGHPDFKAIWAELSRRKAVVFIHPTAGVDTNLVNKSMPLPMYDYPHETGRTAMDLIIKNNLHDYPGCKIILSHAGGDLPYLVYRAAGMLPHMPATFHKSTKEIVEDASKFYFDTAISSNPVTLKALFELAKPGHILFGTDFPNAPSPAIEYFTSNLGNFPMDEEQRKDVYYRGALDLFPRLKNYYG